MKWAHRLLGIVVGVTLLVVSLRMLASALPGDPAWQEFITLLGEKRTGVIGLCLVMVLACVAYGITAVGFRTRSRYLSYDTQHGSISVSLKALQDFLALLRTEFPSILTLVPRVLATDGGLDVVLEVRVRSGAPIPEVSRMIQERARLLIEERIGIADIRGIEVKVEEIVSEKEQSIHDIKPVPPPAGEVP